MSKRRPTHLFYARQSSSQQDEASVNRQIQMTRDLTEQDDLNSTGSKVRQYPDTDDGDAVPPTGRK